MEFIMEICVIHGSNRKGNTDKTISILKEQLSVLDEMVFTDIYLPKDLPRFCSGCFACLSTGEYGGQNCPNKQYTHPIMEKLLRSDGIIIGSPCYALAETAQVKAFMDHFACTYLNHRPNEEMFHKIGLVVSTAAGAGTGRVISTISRSMLFWGVKRIVKCGINVWAKDWADIPDERRMKLEARLGKKAKRFYTLIKNRDRIGRSVYTIGLWFMFKRLVSSYPETEPDKIFWKAKGWIR
jgi:multimeric flavodoxin WrbA